jgi:hypothetical protein
MDIYTQSIPSHQRAAVERLSQLVTNGDELLQHKRNRPLVPFVFNDLEW